MRWERDIAVEEIPLDQVCMVTGDVDASTVWRVKPHLLRHLYAYGPSLWINLADVGFIDSAGLGMLIGLLREARGQGGKVVLLNPRPTVSRTLRITSLDTVFEIVHLRVDLPEPIAA